MLKKFNFVFIAIVMFVALAGTLKAQSLYFCEEYKEGQEVGLSDVFIISKSGGYLTVMFKSDEPIGVKEVDLKVYKVTDGVEKIMETHPFDVEPDWDYIHFDEITFKTAGKYKVTLVTKAGYSIVSGYVKIKYSSD